MAIWLETYRVYHQAARLRECVQHRPWNIAPVGRGIHPHPQPAKVFRLFREPHPAQQFQVDERSQVGCGMYASPVLLRCVDEESTSNHLLSRNESTPKVVLDLYLYDMRYTLTRSPHPSSQPQVKLSPREKEIARLVTKGLPNKAIAAALCARNQSLDRCYAFTARVYKVGGSLSCGDGRVRTDRRFT